MKKSGIKLLAVTMAAVAMLGTMNISAAVVTDGTNFYKLGDSNCDQTVDIRDIIRMKRFLLSTATILEPAANIDGDGAVTTNDIVMVKKYLLGKGDNEPDSALWSAEIR